MIRVIISSSTAYLEYDFWMSKRITNTGLNRYLGTEMPEGHDYTESARYLCNRIGFVPDLDDVELTKGCFAGCESGWDMNPRTSYGCKKIFRIIIPKIQRYYFMVKTP